MGHIQNFILDKKNGLLKMKLKRQQRKKQFHILLLYLDYLKRIQKMYNMSSLFRTSWLVSSPIHFFSFCLLFTSLFFFSFLFPHWVGLPLTADAELLKHLSSMKPSNIACSAPSQNWEMFKAYSLLHCVTAF